MKSYLFSTLGILIAELEFAFTPKCREIPWEEYKLVFEIMSGQTERGAYRHLSKYYTSHQHAFERADDNMRFSHF